MTTKINSTQIQVYDKTDPSFWENVSIDNFSREVMYIGDEVYFKVRRQVKKYKKRTRMQRFFGTGKYYSYWKWEWVPSNYIRLIHTYEENIETMEPSEINNLLLQHCHEEK